MVGSHLLRGPLRTSKELSCKKVVQDLIHWEGRQRPPLLRTEAHDNQDVGLWVFGESNVAAHWVILGQSRYAEFQ